MSKPNMLHTKDEEPIIKMIRQYLAIPLVDQSAISLMWETVEAAKTAQSKECDEAQAKKINTAAGWAAAALGKCISHNATPRMFGRHMKAFKKMCDKYNAQAERVNSLLHEIESLKKQLADFLLDRDAVFIGNRSEIESKARKAAEKGVMVEYPSKEFVIPSHSEPLTFDEECRKHIEILRRRYHVPRSQPIRVNTVYNRVATKLTVRIEHFSLREELDELLPDERATISRFFETQSQDILAYFEQLIRRAIIEENIESRRSYFLKKTAESAAVSIENRISELHQSAKQGRQENAKFWDEMIALIRSNNFKIYTDFSEYAKELSASHRKYMKEIEALNEHMAGWPATYRPWRHLPFGDLLNICNDTRGGYDRFVIQGVVMGLHEFLEKYKDDKRVKKHYEMLMGVRDSIVSSPSGLSAFEVRVSDSIGNEDYSKVLLAVLRAIDSSKEYANIDELMATAVEKIPSIMKLLKNYPLRLINEKDKAVNGFYSYKPYDYTLWYNFTPPKDEGPVHRRYIELIDLALPNSSGLNAGLFTRPYAAIPTMFHENEHFRGDLNEASVHLKTYLFSRSLYAQYSPELAIYDGVFLTLHQLFGRKITMDAIYKLNDIIENFYGAELSDADAADQATRTIDFINASINGNNMMLKWCPQIKWPLLNKEEDNDNYICLYYLLVRYNSQRKSITSGEFCKITQSFHSGGYILSIDNRRDVALNDAETAEAELALRQLLENGLFGSMVQSKDKGKEPIKWKIAERKGDGILLISEKSLAVRRFHNENKPYGWNECELREWLNGYLIYEVFTKAERSLIDTVRLENDNGIETEDRLFLLSAEQAKEMGSDPDRKCSDLDVLALPPPVVPAYGAGAARLAKNNIWWLRSDGKNDGFASAVYFHGAIDGKGFSKYGAKGGVRPVIRIKAGVK